MLLLLRLALRNLLRNKRRTLITACAVAVGLSILVCGSSTTDGMTDSMVENGVGALAGHVVVQGVGYQERREVEIVVPSTPDVAERLGEALPEAIVVKRVFLEGLLTTSTAAMGAAVTAVEPDRELLVSEIGEHVVEGTWLDGNPRGIVLGRKLAENLDAGLGDKVVVMAQGPSDIESRLFRVQGVVSYGVDAIDAYLAYVPLPSAQEMLGLGDGANQISAHLPDARGTVRATARAREALAGEPVEVLSWPEALPELADYVAKEQSDLLVMFPVIWIIVALGIVNTVLMSVIERTHEFGVMTAIGLSKRRLAALVLTEATLLGAFAATLGVALGLAIAFPFMVWGFDMGALMGGATEHAGVANDLVIYASPSPVKIPLYGLAATMITVLAAVYPAIRAARLKPVDALHPR